MLTRGGTAILTIREPGCDRWITTGVAVASLIEVIPGPDGSLPLELIERAYLASRQARDVFVLHGVPRPVVDAALNSVVAMAGMRVHGVADTEVYDEALLDIVRRASLVAATSAAFRGWLDEGGIPFVDAALAPSFLERLTDSGRGEVAPTPLVVQR
jgi:hypothetical protein